MNTAKQIGLAVAGIGVFGLLLYGKAKLSTASPVWWVLILGGFVFAVSTPAKAE